MGTSVGRNAPSLALFFIAGMVASVPGPGAAPTRAQPRAIEAPDADLMRRVMRLLKRGDPGPLEAHLTARDEVRISVLQSGCTSGPGSEESCTERAVLGGAEAFRRWLRETSETWSPRNCSGSVPRERAARCAYPNGLDLRGRLSCDARCCALRRTELMHNTLYLDRVCFTAADRFLRITDIDFTDGA
jgi:hypothetical protein